MPIGSKPRRLGCICSLSMMVTRPLSTLRMWTSHCMKLAGLQNTFRLHKNPHLFYMAPLLRNSRGHCLMNFPKSSHLIMESSSLKMQPESSAIQLCCNGFLSEVWTYTWQIRYLCSSQHLLDVLTKELPSSSPPIVDVISGYSHS